METHIPVVAIHLKLTVFMSIVRPSYELGHLQYLVLGGNGIGNIALYHIIPNEQEKVKRLKQSLKSTYFTKKPCRASVV